MFVILIHMILDILIKNDIISREDVYNLIKDGKIISTYQGAGMGGGFIGFTKENKFILGKMSKEQAILTGYRDAIEFGPYLIVNGKRSFVKGNGGWGTAPRSAILTLLCGKLTLVISSTMR